ncbi:MAG: 50S ribosomal protein L30 [Geobacteraceae bacterium]|nr:50S ribosomal protein L30 [Geobacteraceae bacterium]
MAQLTVTLIKSGIGKPLKHRQILQGLGLKKLNKSVIRDNTPEIQGMIKKVAHMVKVSE